MRGLQGEEIVGFGLRQGLDGAVVWARLYTIRVGHEEGGWVALGTMGGNCRRCSIIILGRRDQRRKGMVL